MRLALCIEGHTYLTEGRVYEVSERFTCDGDSLFQVPAADAGAGHGLCEKCRRPIGQLWLSRRFVPINDVDVKDEVQDELFAV